ncbi:MAG: glycosyltransferase family 2 protein [Cyanobacteria bacterium P01_E01_bin.6]
MVHDLDSDTVLVIIPVRNEEATIGVIITALYRQGIRHIRVVDNGSTDDSAMKAIASGAEVVREPRPGYGQACWTGLQHVPPHIEWILFCDGDGSDDLSYVRELLDHRSSTDFILGDRRASLSGRQAMTPVQNFGNALASTLMAWGWGHRYHDLGPLRLIRRSALEAIQMRDRGFGWTVEMQVRAIELGLTIREIPVKYRPRQGGRSKISGTVKGSVQAGTIILTTIGQLYWRKLFSKHKRTPTQPLSLQQPISSGRQL